MINPHQKINNKNYYILLIILGTILISPVISTQVIPGHDYVFHIARIEDTAEALKEGVFPVRMYVDQVQFWGAPIGIFYPNLFIYFPALLKLMGLPVEICYNVFIALIFYLGLFASWLGFSMLTKTKQIGSLSTALYISSGYYLLDAYIRNALGELLALSFLPLAIACILKITIKQKISIKSYVLSILSISAIIESHVLSSVFLVLITLINLIINHKKITATIVKRILFLSCTILTLNASFIIPFLIYYKTVPLSINFINLFAKSGLMTGNLLRFLLFWNFWVFTALYVFLSKKYHSAFSMSLVKQALFSKYTKYFATGIFLYFISSNLFPWDLIPPLKNAFKIMQFPWRFLGVSTLFLCVCGGFGLYLLMKKKKVNKSFTATALLSILICLTNLVAFSYLNPGPFGKLEDFTSEKRYWKRIPYYSDSDYLYKDMNAEMLFRQGNHYISNARISDYNKTLTAISFSYKTHSDSEIVLPLVNYPGYTATNQSGEKIGFKEDNNHMIIVPLSKGIGKIKVHYEGLAIFRLADYISLITLLVFVLFIFKTHKRKEWNKLI